MKLQIANSIPLLLQPLKSLLANLHVDGAAFEVEYLETLESPPIKGGAESLPCLIVWQSAECALASALEQGVSAADALADWQSHHRLIPQLCFDLRDRAILLEAGVLLANPLQLGKIIAERLALEVSIDDSLAAVNNGDSLARVVATRIVEACQPVADLQAELSALSHLLNDNSSDPSIAQQAYVHYQHLAAKGQQHAVLTLETVDLHAQLDDAKTQLAASLQQATVHQDHSSLNQQQRDQLAAENELLLLQLHQELEQSFTSHQAQVDASLQQATTQQEQSSLHQQQRDQLASENELLLLQLHQVQEELEQRFTSHQAQVEASEALELRHKNEAKALHVQLDDAKTQLAASLPQATARQEQSSQNQQRLDVLATENERLLLQLQQLQQQRQQSVTDNKTRVADSEALTLHHSNAAEGLHAQLADAKTQLAASLQQVTVHQQQSNLNQQRLDELASENELLLLQLHQVQEELEHYFMIYKESEMQFQELDSFKQNLVLLYPHFCSAEQLTLLGGSWEGDYRNLNCLIGNLEHFDQAWTQVNVKILSHQGQPGIEFRSATETLQMPLPGYLETGSDEASGYMVLLPGSEACAELLQRLSTTDLQRIRGIAELLKARLTAGMCQRTEQTQQLDSSYWIETLTHFITLLAETKNEIHYDSVELIECYQTDGYEHLWLRLNNLTYNERILPQLSFKLAAKETTEEGFSDLGCLEFREQESGLAPFIAWPPTQQDEYGPVLSLECPAEMSDQQHDSWLTLTTTDRKMVALLLPMLNRLVSTLDQQGDNLGRPCEQWQQLLHTMAARQPQEIIQAA
mgnify:CR=1 FL=1|tara:strand:- start:9126 stop:11555 length:2430 start_codon:yes stop_codon:yes gene_type:complete